ncbi:hypothetical protein K470DRAFT_270106 [Piedraia hortae CBS 480.64]|uniref:Bacteriophage T5 Orf172 DNA-binding domain-containing protein n=1 Tax=Piedraia hortae CBS 480.64 TaxID=1314780 RepID=A0A6A7C181_9PEZI|nr:hypothetical protein K470DRAFT_270106 [Piedraia hortae CBS 480.64]
MSIKFVSFSPSDIGFTCIHPTIKGPRCRHIINRSDRQLAAKLRTDITTVKPNDELLPTLKLYATLCVCKQAHRRRADELGRLDQIARQWLHELGGHSMIPPPSLQRFIQYTPKRSDKTFAQTMLSPLGQHESPCGNLYMFRRESDPGFLKIGYTRQVVDERLFSIEMLCGFVPQPLRQIRRVPCALRVERLIHAELGSYRRKSTSCSDSPTCGSVHSEWFEMDVEHAEQVVDALAWWAIVADPYGVDGDLKPFWRRKLLQWRGGADSQALSQALCELDVMEAVAPSPRKRYRREPKLLPWHC